MEGLKRMRFKHDLLKMLFVRVIDPGPGIMKFAIFDGEDEIDFSDLENRLREKFSI